MAATAIAMVIPAITDNTSAATAPVATTITTMNPQVPDSSSPGPRMSPLKETPSEHAAVDVQPFC